jgi:hypothetical protein
MGRLLDALTALFAFGAAVFWFLSAYGKLPPMVTYFDFTPESDPFLRQLEFSARMNSIAAAYSGVSVLFFSIKIAFWP